MVDLIKGVTKIKWVGEDNPKIKPSLFIHKEGTFIREKYYAYEWLSPDGVPFLYCSKFTLDSDKDSQIVLATTEYAEAPIKSTGGSSSYYKVELPQWVIDKQTTNGYIMLEDLAEVLYGNDFNYVNVFKAQKRMFELEQGAGKCGNTIEYDATKCKYYVDKQVEVFNRKGE